MDGIELKRSWAGEVRNVSLLVVIAVNGEDYREILGICEGVKEDKAGWSAFLKHLKECGLNGVRLIISDACLGLAEYAAKRLSASFARCGGAAGTITALVRSAWGSAQSEAAFIANSAILLNSTPSV